MANGTKTMAVVLGVLALVACAKEKPAETIGTTTTTRGAAARPQPPAATVEEVRTTLLQQRPTAADTINGLIIMGDGGVITLRGRVKDEATHSDLVNRVRSMPNVRGVRDEIQVVPKGGATAPGTQQPSAAAPTGQPGDQAHAMSKSDAVRKSMRQVRPMANAVIDALTITDDGQVVTLEGTVPDETTHQALLRAARETQGVTTVKDDLRIERPNM